MQIRLKRGFPWFPVVLAAGWISMMALAIHDLAWFAASGASLDGHRSTVALAAKAVPSATAVSLPIGGRPCAAAAIAPAARIIR